MRMFKLMFTIILLLGVTSFIMADEKCHEEVTIYRDSYGVAHISAPNMEALFTAWGYTTAQDRLFTIETLRAASQGRIAEMFGPGENNSFIEFDKFQRTCNVPTKGELQREMASIPHVYRKLLQAYANGINMWIEKVLDKPDELLHYAFIYHGIKTIEPWTDWDVAQAFNWVYGGGFLNGCTAELIDLEVYSHLVTNFGEETAQKMINDMMPPNVPDCIPTLPGYNVNSLASVRERNINGKVKIVITDGIKDACKQALAQYQIKKKVFRELGFPPKEGSYIFMVGGKKTKDNDTYFFGGPQSGFFYPSRFYETGLHCPGMNVVGISFFGVPAMLIGSNENVGYGATSTIGNVLDIFMLTLDRDNYHYIYKDKRKKMNKRSEIVKVKGQDHVKFDVYSCVYGPVFAWGEGVAFAQKQGWAGRSLDTFVSIIKLMQSKNGAQFREACRSINSAVNLGYADNKGNFGYVYCGPTPITNPHIDTRFPTPGTGDYDWQGYRPFSWHPKGSNLEQGYIVNWNNIPTIDFEYTDGWFGYWNSYNRVYRLNKLLETKDKVTFEDAKGMIKDIATTNLHGDYLLPYFEEALKDETDPGLLKALNILQDWKKYNVDDDYDGFYDGAGYTIWKAWIEKVFTTAFANELGPYFFMEDVDFIYTPCFPNLVIHHLEGENSAVPIQYDGWLNGYTMKQIIRNSLVDVLNDLESQYPGLNMEMWLTPVNPLVFLPGFYFGVPGGPIGVRNLHVYMYRGTYDHIIHFSKGKLENSVNISAPGTSEFVDPNGIPSPHFDDQLDLFEDFKGYKPMHVHLGDSVRDAESVETLHVKLKGK